MIRALRQAYRIAFATALAACAAGWFATPSTAATPAGTNISNSASATYADGSGGNFTVNSNTITIVVQNVAIASISNISTGQTIAPYQTITDKFLLTNAGNNAGKFALTALPLPTAQTGIATVPVTITVTPQGGSATVVSFTGNNANDLASVNTALAGLTIASGATLEIDIKYGSGSFVAQATQTEQTTLSATLTYAGGTGYSGTTSAASTSVQSDTLQPDAVLDVDVDGNVPVNASDPIAYTYLAANHGYFATQPVALGSVGLPGSGIVAVMAKVPTFNANALALRAVPAVATSTGDGYAGSGVTIYYTTATPPFSISTTWTAVTGGTTLSQLALVSYVAVVVTGPSSISGKGPSFSSTGNVPSGAVALTVQISQPTGPGSNLPGAVTAMANSAVGSNATDGSGTLTPLLIGPNATGNYDNTAVSAASFNGMFANTLALGDSGASGSGYSDRVTNFAVSGSVNLGPVGYPSATGGFSWSAGMIAYFDSGAPDNNHDFTAMAVYSGITGNAANDVTPSFTTPASPTAFIFPNTVMNLGNVADTYTITASALPDTVAWTVQYATNPACTGATSSFTTPSVAVNATYTFYACYTPPGNTAVQVFWPYGFQLTATSIADATASNTTYNLMGAGGFVGIFKDAVVGGTPSVGTGACASIAAPGCTITFALTYMNGNPASGRYNLYAGPSLANNGGTLVSAGIAGLNILDDGVNGANKNAATNNKNTWGNLALTSGLTAPPSDPSGKCTFYYLYDGSVMTASNGTLTPPTPSTPATAFRCAYGANVLAPDLIQTLTFAVTIK